MALKEQMIDFFTIYRDKKEEFITSADLEGQFNAITEYHYSNPNQFQFFKSSLINGGFLTRDIHQPKRIFHFNWDHIYLAFSELKKDTKQKK